MIVDLQSPLWALTTYYNPAKYKRRLANYRAFRSHLTIPLVTVELGFESGFELAQSDADVLMQVPGRSVMWQKERLLNIALSHVPAKVPLVAWLDCDVIFDITDWARRTIDLLHTRQLVQLFDCMFDLGRDSTDRATTPTGVSIASLMASHSWEIDDFRPPSTTRLRRCLFGLAWAGRRALLEKHGFYDAMILGSGDRALACAGFGRFEDAIHMSSMDTRRSTHYLEWAKPFYDEVQGNMGFVEGNLLHLWHGDIANRRYVERHRDLAQLNFNPYEDIALDANGCWQWVTDKHEMHKYVSDYFSSRKEDGDRGCQPPDKVVSPLFEMPPTLTGGYRPE